jgi:hypothetical protein
LPGKYEAYSLAPCGLLGLPLQHEYPLPRLLTRLSLLHQSLLGLLILPFLLTLISNSACDLAGSCVLLSCAMVFPGSAFTQRRLAMVSDSPPSVPFPPHTAFSGKFSLPFQSTNGALAFASITLAVPGSDKTLMTLWIPFPLDPFTIIYASKSQYLTQRSYNVSLCPRALSLQEQAFHPEHF